MRPTHPSFRAHTIPPPGSGPSRSPRCLFPDHCLLGVQRWNTCSCCVICCSRTSESGETQERRRRIKRTRENFWVRLQANEERVPVIYRECIEMMTTWRGTDRQCSLCSPLVCNLSTYIGFTSYRWRWRSHNSAVELTYARLFAILLENGSGAAPGPGVPPI